MTVDQPELPELINRMMEAYASDAVNAAREQFGTELDYSAESVALLEDLLGKLAPSAGGNWFTRLVKLSVSDEELDTFCKMFGGYLGEVMRRRHDGTWVLSDNPTGEDSVIGLEIGETKVFPPSKVRKRLIDGKGDDVALYFQVVMGMVASAA